MDNRKVIYRVWIIGPAWEGTYNLCLTCLDRLTLSGHNYMTRHLVTDAKCERCKFHDKEHS